MKQTSGRTRSDETKQKISEYNKIGICGMLGKTHSEKTKKKISDSNKRST